MAQKMIFSAYKKLKKMKIQYYFITCLLYFTTVFIVAAQESNKKWTLNECIEYAVENNIELNRMELTVQKSEKDVLQSKMNYLPAVNGFATHELNWGNTFSYDLLQYVDQEYYRGYFGARSSVELFNGFYNHKNLQKNKFTHLASHYQLEEVKNDISLQVLLYYLETLFKKDLMQAAKEQYEMTGMQVERTKKMVETGKSAKSDLLEIKAQQALEKVNLTNAGNAYRMALLNLAHLLNLKNADQFDVENIENLEFEEEKEIESTQEIFSSAVTILPQIKSAEYQLKSSEKTLDISKWQRSPSLTLNGLFYTRYSEIAVHPSNYDNDPSNDVENYQINDQINDFAYKQIALSLNIPIFNQWSTETEISKNKINYLDSKLNLENEKQILYKNIEQAHADAIASRENYLARKDAFEAAKEAFKFAEKRFNVGLIHSVEYNDNKSKLSKAEADLLQSKYEYYYQLQVLNFYKKNQVSY